MRGEVSLTFITMANFEVNFISSSPDPQKVMWITLCQDLGDYDLVPLNSEGEGIITEKLYGQAIVSCLSRNLIPYTELTNATITFGCGFFPSTILEKIIEICSKSKFSSQSLDALHRTFIKVCNQELSLDDFVYLPEVSTPIDSRNPTRLYSRQDREKDLDACRKIIKDYQKNPNHDFLDYISRFEFPIQYRQHFVVSLPPGDFFKLFDYSRMIDHKEIKTLCEMMFPFFKRWIPEITNWYQELIMGSN